jgi:CRISPR/Cas system CMR-associated protein Cmr1 (group 7 of RAMP superfamily)
MYSFLYIKLDKKPLYRNRRVTLKTKTYEGYKYSIIFLKKKLRLVCLTLTAFSGGGCSGMGIRAKKGMGGLGFGFEIEIQIKVAVIYSSPCEKVVMHSGNCD